ncbi:MAG: hypothetical protein J7I99_03660, partial [Methanophagales archaeon]|nr:hypothetical protein [Methanophagales archaeon]
FIRQRMHYFPLYILSYINISLLSTVLIPAFRRMDTGYREKGVAKYHCSLPELRQICVNYCWLT